jgi:hypothetical protein
MYSEQSCYEDYLETRSDRADNPLERPLWAVRLFHGLFIAQAIDPMKGVRSAGKPAEKLGNIYVLYLTSYANNVMGVVEVRGK